MEELNKTIQAKNQELQAANKGLPNRIGQKLGMDQQLQHCIQKQCSELVERAKYAAEMIQEKAAKPYRQETADEFMKDKFTSFEQAALVYDANECQNKCQRPGKVLMSAIQVNSKLLGSTFMQCQQECAAKHRDVNEERGQCALNCIEGTHAILNGLEQHIYDDFQKNMDKLTHHF